MSFSTRINCLLNGKLMRIWTFSSFFFFNKIYKKITPWKFAHRVYIWLLIVEFVMIFIERYITCDFKDFKKKNAGGNNLQKAPSGKSIGHEFSLSPFMKSCYFLCEFMSLDQGKFYFDYSSRLTCHPNCSFRCIRSCIQSAWIRPLNVNVSNVSF